MNKPKKPAAMPAGGLTIKQLEHFVNEATRAHWNAYSENGGTAIFDFHLGELLYQAITKFPNEADQARNDSRLGLWEQYENGEITPDPTTGRLDGGYTEAWDWLNFDTFAPLAHFYPDESLEQLARRIERYSYAISKTQFLWRVTRGVVGIVEAGGTDPRWTLYNSDFPAADDEARELRRLPPQEVAAYYEDGAKPKFEFPLSFNLKDGAGRPFPIKAKIQFDVEFYKYLSTQRQHVAVLASIHFDGAHPWGSRALALQFWNATEAAIKARIPRLDLPTLDWELYLESALLVDTEGTPDAVQEEIPLAIKGKASLAHFIDLATFAFPSDTKSRLVTQAFGVTPSKDLRELSRILEKPEAERTAQEIQRAEEIKGGLILSSKTKYSEDFKPMGVTLETKVRETNAIAAKAIVEIRAETPADGSEITESHIEAAINTFFKYFASTFHGQGLRHWALILKELIQGGWAYRFEASEHIGKMRNLKPGESPSRAEREQARRIVTYLCDTFLDVQSKRGQQHATKAQRFFYIDKIEAPKEKRRGETLTIRATPELMTLFQSSAGTALQYIPMLESIVREDHQDHGIAIALYFHLAPLWRMDPIRRVKVRDVFDLIGKDPSPENEHRTRDLKKLERELDYMVTQAPPYLGSWDAAGPTGERGRPSKFKRDDPFDAELTLIAPEWKRLGVEKIQARRAAYLPKAPSAAEGLTREGLEAAIKASGLSANKFAEAIGFSRGILSETRSGKRQVTPALEAKIRARFPDLLRA